MPARRRRMHASPRPWRRAASPAIRKCWKRGRDSPRPNYNPRSRRRLDGLGDGHFAVRDVLFKYHAACYGTHETIEGILRLKDTEGSPPPTSTASPSRCARPSLGHVQHPGADHAARGSSACASLPPSRSSPATRASRRSPTPVRDSRLVAVRDQVSVEARTGSGDWDGTRVAVSLRDGRTLESTVDLNILASDLDQRQRLEAKFAGLATCCSQSPRARLSLPSSGASTPSRRRPAWSSWRASRFQPPCSWENEGSPSEWRGFLSIGATRPLPIRRGPARPS